MNGLEEPLKKNIYSLDNCDFILVFMDVKFGPLTYIATCL
jgi:hypothetical protein